MSVQFFSGGGEMGELIRKKDWNSTQLGPMEAWPSSLKVTIGILLKSKFPMFLWWGADLICFYNDAYRPSLGIDGKHPAILGIKAKDAWVEIWDIIKPLIDQVMSTEEAVWSEDMLVPIFRNGKIEDVYWTFSYSPVPDDSGNTSGVLVTCVETTEKVIVKRQLEESERRLRLIISQAPVSIAIFRGQDHVTEIANSRALELWGRSEQEVVGKPVLEAMPELKNQGIGTLLDDVYTSGKRFSAVELPVQILRNGKLETAFVNFSYEALYNKDGKIDGIIAVGAEVTVQVLAHKKVEANEEKLSIVVEASKLGIWELDITTKSITYSKRYLEIFGFDADSAPNHIDLLQRLHPEDVPLRNRLFEQALDTGYLYYQARLVWDDQSVHWFEVRGKVFYNDDNTAFRITGTIRDITEERVNSQKLQESETRFRDLIAQSPIPMVVLKGKEHIIDIVNVAMLKRWNKPEEFLVGRTMSDVFPEVNDRNFITLLDKVYKSGKPYRESESVLYIQDESGLRTFYVDFEYVPLIAAGGEVSGVIATVNDVTERVEARKKIEENDQKFRDTVKQAPVGITILRGRSFLVEMANDAYLALIDRTEPEFVGKLLFEALPEVEGSVRELLENVLDTGVPFHGIELPIPIHRHGKQEVSYFDFLYHPLRENDGTVSGIIVTVTDVSVQVLARTKVEESNLFNQTVLENSPDCVKVLDIDGNINFININGVAILEAEHKDFFINRKWAAMWKNGAQDLINNGVNQARKGETTQFKAQANTLKGNSKWWNVTITPIKNARMEVISILALSRDITDEVKREQVLMESEEKFRLLADSMPQQIWTSDLQGKLDYFNQSVFDYSGLTQQQLIEDGWIQIVHPDDRPGNISEWQHSIATGQDFRFEHRFRRRDGEYRWMLSRGIPHRDADGNIQMWVGTSTDIQDQKIFSAELERQVMQRTGELAQNNVVLEKMNKELQSFAYISSHDLQEPLRKIQTFATLLLEKEFDSLSEKGQDYFRRMQLAAERMQTLIDDLLAYSRTNTDERMVECEDLLSMVNEVKNDLQEEIEDKRAVVVVTETCQLQVIRFQFRQLLQNLISNALKFSVAGRRPHITIAGRLFTAAADTHEGFTPGKTYAHISISDNGIGFEQQYSDKIFELFQRLHSRDHFPGTGMGLAIVKKIVDNHDGVIAASGMPGSGATFDIYIPA